MKIPEEIKEQIKQREMTAREAASILGISEQYLCKLLKDQGVKRIAGITTAHRNKMSELFDARRRLRKLLAEQVKKKSKTIKQAAREGNCSERTIYRYLDEC